MAMTRSYITRNKHHIRFLHTTSNYLTSNNFLLFSKTSKNFQEMALVRALVNERPVVIFSKSSCCMCYTIKTLISSFGANATVYELDEHPEGKQIEKELRGLGCKPSVPAVFIGEDLIGGANEIMSLHLKGQLVQLLLKANAIWL